MINRKEAFTKSNLLSLLRLLLAIPFWFLLDNLENNSIRYFTFGLCLFAAFTDILDGYLARKFNEVTEYGKIIDPLSDKVAIGTIIIKLYLSNEIPSYYFFMIIGRDVLIFIGGIIVSKRIGRVLPSNVLGKITVIFIGITILMIILQIDRSGILFKSFYGLSIVLIFASLAGYIIRAFEFLKQKSYGSV
jgi:CDP-diacylglycerol--glycerol-3-phosphate 3-phosphatidyltransferase